MAGNPVAFRLFYGAVASRGRFRLTVWANGWGEPGAAQARGAVLLWPTTLSGEPVAAAFEGEAGEILRLLAMVVPPQTTPDVEDYTRTGSATMFLELDGRAHQLVSNRSYRFTGPDAPALNAALDELMMLAGVPVPPEDEIIY